MTLNDVMEVSNQPSAQRALMDRRDSASSQPKTMFSFRVEGADRPGIVKEVTAVLAQHQVNCERLESYTKKKPPPVPTRSANGGSNGGSGADASEPAGSAVFVLTGDAESSPGTVRDSYRCMFRLFFLSKAANLTPVRLMASLSPVETQGNSNTRWCCLITDERTIIQPCLLPCLDSS